MLTLNQVAASDMGRVGATTETAIFRTNRQKPHVMPRASTCTLVLSRSNELERRAAEQVSYADWRATRVERSRSSSVARVSTSSSVQALYEFWCSAATVRSSTTKQQRDDVVAQPGLLELLESAPSTRRSTSLSIAEARPRSGIYTSIDMCSSAPAQSWSKRR